MSSTSSLYSLMSAVLSKVYLEGFSRAFVKDCDWYFERFSYVFYLYFNKCIKCFRL